MCPTPWPSGRPTASIIPQRLPDISRRCSCRAPFNGPNHDRGEPVTPLGQGRARRCTCRGRQRIAVVLLSTTSPSAVLASSRLRLHEMRRDMRLPYRPKSSELGLQIEPNSARLRSAGTTHMFPPPSRLKTTQPGAGRRGARICHTLTIT
ncbi:hypothetical protein HYQ46_000973 [Verticillium longisporum]|nr:hypothetical protein HYQ46_000973 [Verticillium longisporum]